MAGETEQLVVQLEARIDKFEKSFQRASKTANDNWQSIENRGKRASANLESTFAKAVEGINKKGEKLGETFVEGFGFKELGGSIAAALSVEKIREFSDAWLEAKNKIGGATGDIAQAGVATGLVADIAVRSRSSFESTASLFANMSRASKELGASEAQVAVVTETVGKSLSLAGAGAQQAQAAIYELGQALGAGRLDGSELRSILEEAPQLAAIISESFGTTVAGLRELATEGELDSKKIFDALLKAAPKVDQAFKGSTATVSQSFTVLEAQAIKYVGNSASIQAATSLAANAIQGLAGHLDVAATGAAALGSILAARLLAAGITPAIAGVGSLVVGLGEGAVGMAALAAESGIAAVSVRIFAGAMALAGGPVGVALLAATAAITYFATEAQNATPVNDAYAAALDKIKASADGATPSIKATGDATLEAATAIAEVTTAAQNNNLKAFANDAGDVTEKLRAMVDRLLEFGATGVNAEEKQAALKIILDALNGDAQAALSARSALIEMGTANPNFSAAFTATEALLQRLAVVRTAALSARAAIAGAAGDEQSARFKALNANTTGQAELAAYEKTQTSNTDYLAEETRRSKLSTADKAIEDRAKTLRDAAKKAGGDLSPDQSKTDAAALIANEDAVTASEKSPAKAHAPKVPKTDEAKRWDKIKLQIKSLEEETRAEDASVAALGKSDAEKRIALELSKQNVDAQSAEGLAIRKNVEAIVAGEKAVTDYDAAQQKLKATGNFFQSTLESSIEKLVLDGGRLKDVFTSVAKELEKAALKAALLGQGPLAGLLGGGAGGASGGLLGGLGSLISGAASGGSNPIASGAGANSTGGVFGAGSGILGLLGSIMPKFAAGGHIQGPGGPRDDSILAAVSSGEFIINAAATKKNLGLLQAINSGKLPKFADGGLVSASPVSSPALRSSAGGAGGSNIALHNNVTVNASGGTPEANADLAKQIGDHVEARVSQAIDQHIRSNMRPGGLFNR